jgi:hypothetical protein
MSEEISAVIDLQNEFFNLHAEFLAKVSIQKNNDGTFTLNYPRKFSSKAEFIKHFEMLLWFWAMTTLMEKYEAESKNDKATCDYAR